MNATIHFSLNIKADSFPALQKKIREITKLLDELDITYSLNSEGAA